MIEASESRGAAGADLPRDKLEHRLSVTDAARGVPGVGVG